VEGSPDNCVLDQKPGCRGKKDHSRVLDKNGLGRKGPVGQRVPVAHKVLVGQRWCGTKVPVGTKGGVGQTVVWNRG